MNEARSSESCRIVSVSPCPPSSTSWCATRPGSRTECTCTPSCSAPLAPSAAVVVASGTSPRPAAARAALIRSAVLAAVPDGASTLFAWCSSIISADSKNLAACAANRIIRTAPTEKFGAIMTRTSGALSSHPVTVSSRSWLNPDVPTTTFRPWLMHHSRLPRTSPGAVKSTTASQRASACRSSPWSTVTASSRSPAASTAWHTAVPIRPLAPSTPTLIIRSLPGAGSGGERAGVVEGAHHGQRLGPGQHVGGDSADLVVADRLDRGQDLVDRLEVRVDQLGLAEPAHPGRRVLEAEHDRPAELALAALQLGVGQPAVDHLADLVPADGQHLVRLGREAAHVHAPDAGVGMLRAEAVHRVGQPPLLPHLLEQPGRHAAAQRGVEHAERVLALVGPGQALAAEHQVGLLDRARHQPHAGARIAPGR